MASRGCIRMLRRLFTASIRESIKDGLFLALWRTGVWRLLVFLLIYSTGLAIIYPITPTLMTNGFASLAAGHPIDCNAYTPATSPRECIDAHSTAVTWMSWTNFVSSSMLTFLCAPYVGHLSDRLGRKPFMLVGIALTLLPLAVIQLHLHGGAPIYWYYPASAIGGVVSSFNMALTSVADLLEQRHRATAVGYLTSCFSLGMLVGPVLGGYLSMTAALWTCIALTAATLLFVATCVPECAPGPLARRAAAAAAAASGPGAGEGSGSGASKHEAEEAGCGHAAAQTEAGEEEEVAAAALVVAEGVFLVAAQQHLMAAPAGPTAEGAAAHMCRSGPDLTDPWDALTDPQGRDDSLPGPCGSSSCSGAAAGSASGAAAAGHGVGGDAAGGGGDVPLVGDGASGGDGMTSGWVLIYRSGYFQRIAAIWIVVSMTWEGAGELLMQYLQLKLGFDTRDQAHVLMVLASGGLVVKLGLLALLVRVLGERRLLAFGLLAYGAECLALAGASSKATGLSAVSVGSLASVCWPALVALQTAGVPAGQQGAVFGAVQAISSMASGLGPLLFAAVFRAVTRSDSELPPAPGVVWYMAAAMTAVAVGLAITLPQPEVAAAVAEGRSGSAGKGGEGEGGDVEEAGRAAGSAVRAEGDEEGLREPLLQK